MSTANALLDEALQIGSQELSALRVEDVDRATMLCEKRAALIDAGWEQREAAPSDLRPQLLALRSLQQSLILEGNALKQRIQYRLNQSKQQMRRMRGYGRAVQQAKTMR